MTYELAEVALISGGSAIVGPLLLAYLHGQQAIAREKRSFARQDEVANRVSEVAAKADMVAMQAAVAASETKTQLAQIHVLVNSDMTAARLSDLNQTKKSCALLKRLIASAKTPSHADLEELSSYEERIKELEAILADRLAQFKLIGGGVGGMSDD